MFAVERMHATRMREEEGRRGGGEDKSNVCGGAGECEKDYSEGEGETKCLHRRGCMQQSISNQPVN